MKQTHTELVYDLTCPFSTEPPTAYKLAPEGNDDAPQC
jgi:hypothetical protein